MLPIRLMIVVGLTILGIVLVAGLFDFWMSTRQVPKSPVTHQKDAPHRAGGTPQVELDTRFERGPKQSRVRAWMSRRRRIGWRIW